ncbi:hydroxymethylbilane synthase [Spongisporangium articulatum]|uniref:Porphobilinogen deaminase n=1 Tax=Spongisporangium articulatum TaxID=3362603 RepID=A0ABW8ANM0_9ACTN
MTTVGIVPTRVEFPPALLPRKLRLGTRRSKLALTQSQWVADRLTESLAALGATVEVELVEVTTHGDATAKDNTPLATLGGTGVFVTALRDALLRGEVDLAVHSLKDLPTGPAEGLSPVVVPLREDPRDALVARDGLTLAELPAGARIGTGSPRRAAQLLALGLGHEVVGLRGNVDTRLGKVTSGELDAVVLAVAGLRRINRAAEITELLDPLLMLPAPGQGALAVECREADPALREALELVQDDDALACVLAERALLARLEAGCSAPVGALADVVEGDDGPELSLRAMVAALDGSVTMRRSSVVPLAPDISGSSGADRAERARAAGHALAEQMLAEGAADLMSAPDSETPARAPQHDPEGDQ